MLPSAVTFSVVDVDVVIVVKVLVVEDAVVVVVSVAVVVVLVVAVFVVAVVVVTVVNNICFFLQLFFFLSSNLHLFSKILRVATRLRRNIFKSGCFAFSLHTRCCKLEERVLVVC